MSKTNIFVVEDENIVSKDIQNSLKKLGYSVVGAASSGEDAVEQIKKLKPDLVLMDIMLKGDMSGIDAADIVRKDYKIPVIFLTAYADEGTLSKAKITEPYGYIIKPFKEIDLHTSIEMALYKHKKNVELAKEIEVYSSIIDNKGTKDFVFIKSKQRLVRVNTAEIFFVEALKDYVIINTPEKKYTIHSTMKDIQTKLPNDQFMRVHRSFIVRIDKISAIEQSNLIIEKYNKLIPIGGSYRDGLLDRLNFV